MKRLTFCQIVYHEFAIEICILLAQLLLSAFPEGTCLLVVMLHAVQ